MAQDSDIGTLLGRAVIDPRQPLVEAQVYEAARVPRIPTFRTAGEWEKYAVQLRERILNEVILRGEAVRWGDAATKVEWRETIPGGPGYHRSISGCTRRSLCGSSADRQRRVGT